MADRRVTILVAARDRASRTLRDIGGSLQKMGLGATVSTAGLTTMAGVAGGLFARSVISAASTSEQLQLRLDASWGAPRRGRGRSS
jgi:hypothetical protein